MNKRPVLAVDFDDVLFNCNGALCDFHNTHYGTSLRRDDITTWWLKDIWKCTEEEAVRRVREFVQSPYHDEGLPVVGAREALRRSKEKYDIHIVTSRLDEMRDKTLLYLEKHFAGLFDEIHFTNHFEDITKISKSDICKRIEAAYLVEDSLIHANDVAATETKVLLLDTPWNREELPAHITRVFSWEEVLTHIS